MSIALLREALANLISTDLASRNSNWTAIEAALNRIDDTDLTENSILYKIKHYGEGATLTDTEERFVADTIAAALAELAGAGRTTETVKGNADAIALRELSANKVTAFQETPDDTHYPSEKLVDDSLEAIKGVDYTDGTLKSHEDRLDTLEGADTVAGSVAKTVKDAVEPVKGTGWTGENLVDHESRIVVLENWTRVKSFLDVQEVVRAGRGEAYFPIGLQLGADWNYTSRVWDVIGIDHDIPTDTGLTHSLTIQAHDILRSGRISAPEAMYNAVTELPAGTYIFTTNGVQYTFTSTKAVPAGGVIYIKTRSEYVPLTLTIYGADRTTIIEDNIVVTPTTGTDNLTPINDRVRMRRGSNLYKISAIRQWLNSEDATFVWQPLGLYDMPSSYETAGFINLLDADLQAVIGAVDKQVARTTYDGGGQDTFSDKVFLLSRKEIFGDDEGVVTGESVYEFWDDVTDADRIKGSPTYWWLRSPDVDVNYLTRNVLPSGVLNRGGADNAYGLAPACVIY